MGFWGAGGWFHPQLALQLGGEGHLSLGGFSSAGQMHLGRLSGLGPRTAGGAIGGGGDGGASHGCSGKTTDGAETPVCPVSTT